jgi:hypothetical protein
MTINMNNNPETLKYKLGQKVVWQDEDYSYKQGVVINIGFKGLDVLCNSEEFEVPFESIIEPA